VNSIWYVVIVGLLALGCGGFLAWRWRRVASREPRIILTGGGTGGHVNPALAIAEGIRKREPGVRFLYVGVRGKAESVIVKRAGYELRFVASAGFPGLRPSLSLARFLCLLTAGVLQSAFILVRFAPRWVIATGGYVSAPIILATLLLRIVGLSPTKIFLHEQNSIPGQLNAFLGRWVDRVFLTFPQTLSFFPRNGVLVGYPIRQSIVLKPREEALAHLPFQVPPGRRVVFVFGGSQGARTINRSLVEALPHLIEHRQRLFIIHGTGLSRSSEYDAAADTERCLEKALSPEQRALLDGFYYRQDYFHNIADVYAISDLIVCRSGAGSLNEISRMGKPAILIPKANLPGDHQVMNARAMKDSGAVEILLEDTIIEEGRVLEKLDGRLLAERIWSLLDNLERLTILGAMSREFFRQHAVERILSELYGDHRFDNGRNGATIPFRALLSKQRLLQVLGSAYGKAPRTYDPRKVVADEDDLVCYRHRAATLLTSKGWPDRNIGVKLIGLTHYREKIPTLLHMLVDRTPTSPLRRWFGGDFEQVAFIRRNIVQALQVINHCDEEIEKHLLMALDDPYYEVRSHVCAAVAHFAPVLAGKEVWVEAMMKGLRDPSFEVVVEAAGALGEIGGDQRVLQVLLELRESHYWQVRNAALIAIRRLVERAVVQPSEAMLAEVSCFILTATDFRPHFSIKQTYQSVHKRCRENLAGETRDQELASSHPDHRERTT